MEKITIPIWEKQNLTIQEAAEYSNIGINKLYSMIKDPFCPFILRVGDKKTLIKKKAFDDYIANSVEI